MASNYDTLTPTDVLSMCNIRQQIEQWITKSTSVNIFVTGKMGTGKSTLVNSIVGSVVSPEGHTVYPETDKVLQLPPKVINSIEVNVWDSPGLQDGTRNEEEYLRDIKVNCKEKADLILYCVNMSIARFVPGNQDIIAMKKLSTTLGEDMWKKTLIVLTFANRYIYKIEDDFEDNLQGLQEKFVSEVDSWKGLIHSALQNEVGLNPELVQTIKVAPAGNYLSLSLPGCECWLSRVWAVALTVTRPLAQPAFVKISENRLKSKNEHILTDSLSFERPLLLAEIGRIIGEGLGMPETGFQLGLQVTNEEKTVILLSALSKYQNGHIPIAESAEDTVDIDSHKKYDCKC